MNDIQNDIATIEVTLEELKATIKKRDDLDILMKSPAFKNVILDGYFKELASNTVLLKGDKKHQSDDQQKDLENQLVGIAMLNQYFSALKMMADRAEMDISADDITLAELREEEIS